MQNLLDDIKKTFSQTAHKAVKKTGEILEYSKITLAITATQNDIERELSAIGMLIYSGYKKEDVSTETVTEKCEIIEAKQAEIDELRERLATIKNVVTCGNCGAQVSAKSLYCAKCGEKI